VLVDRGPIHYRTTSRPRQIDRDMGLDKHADRQTEHDRRQRIISDHVSLTVYGVVANSKLNWELQNMKPFS